ARQLLLVEAGAGVAHIHERAARLRAVRGRGSIVDAEQERAEVRPRMPRLGPSTDDELLFANDLQLPPVGRALAGLVQRRAVLRDQAFPTMLQRLAVQRAGVAADLPAQSQRRVGRAREQPLERGAP